VRRWYEQFYCDVADVAPDMTARYEFEIDTTRAVAGWEAEVAANLARPAGGPGPAARGGQGSSVVPPGDAAGGPEPAAGGGRGSSVVPPGHRADVG